MVACASNLTKAAQGTGSSPGLLQEEGSSSARPRRSRLPALGPQARAPLPLPSEGTTGSSDCIFLFFPNISHMSSMTIVQGHNIYCTIPRQSHGLVLGLPRFMMPSRAEVMGDAIQRAIL